MTAASLLAPDGFINATLLCQRFNFNLSQWLQAAATQQLINSEPTDVLRNVTTGPSAQRGVYVCERLALSLAEAISPAALASLRSELTTTHSQSVATNVDAENERQRQHELALADATLRILQAKTALVRAAVEPQLIALRIDMARAEAALVRATTEQQVHGSIIRTHMPDSPLYQEICKRYAAAAETTRAAGTTPTTLSQDAPSLLASSTAQQDETVRSAMRPSVMETRFEDAVRERQDKRQRTQQQQEK